jgi:hypothetical protein
VGKERLFARGGVRSFKKRYLDGTEETFYYTSRTSSECAGFKGAIRAFAEDEAGCIARDKYLGKFIASAMCDETGAALFTPDEMTQVPENTKVELALLIINGSEELGDAGKG